MRLAQVYRIGFVLLSGLLYITSTVGLHAAEAEFDLQKFIDQEVSAAKTQIVIPPGRYRVTPTKRQHLQLRGLNDIQIIADGVEMICTQTTRAITLTDCQDVTLQGMVIDYDPLPFTQGEIKKISADKLTYSVELFKGYPAAETVRNFKYEVFQSDTRMLRCADRRISKVEEVDANHLELTYVRVPNQDFERVGDLIVINSDDAPDGAIPHAILCEQCRNMQFVNIALCASPSFGFVELNCEGNIYTKCRIDRRKADRDIVPRDSSRLRSLNADAFHSKFATKGPAYDACTARYMGDDCVNICGDYHIIMSGEGPKLRVLAKRNLNIQVGDPVAVMNYNGESIRDVTAIGIEPAGNVTEQEIAFLQQQPMRDELRSAEQLADAFEITLDREISVMQGATICASNRVGSNFAVRNCSFGFNRSRGIIVNASAGEITGNRIEGCWMSSVLVAPSFWWLEAGSSNDLKIESNQIIDCRSIAICVKAIAGNGELAPAGAHQNIQIIANEITGGSRPAILVTSTRDLMLENNKLKKIARSTALPPDLRKLKIPESQSVVEIQCE